MGRNLSFSAEIGDLILEGIDSGLTITLACARAGISHKLVDSWKKIAERDQKPQELVDFCIGIKKASGNRARRWLGYIEKGASTDWRAASWLLEKCHRKDYDKPKQQIVQAQEMKPILTPEERLAKIKEIAARIKGK